MALWFFQILACIKRRITVTVNKYSSIKAHLDFDDSFHILVLDNGFT